MAAPAPGHVKLRLPQRVLAQIVDHDNEGIWRFARLVRDCHNVFPMQCHEMRRLDCQAPRFCPPHVSATHRINCHNSRNVTPNRQAVESSKTGRLHPQDRSTSRNAARREECPGNKAVCSRRLRSLGRAAHRGVLRSERPSGRGLGPDRPERGGRHPGGAATQSPRPQGALVPARRRARLLRGRPAQLPDRGAARRGPALPLVRGRALPVGVSAGRGRAADLHLLAHPGRRPAQPHRRADAHRRPRLAVVDVPDPAIRAQSRRCPGCRRASRSPTRSATC